MLTIDQLLKLYTRGRLNKLLREGMEFLRAHADELPADMSARVTLHHDVQDRVEFSFRNFSFFITTNDLIRKTSSTVEIPYADHRFEGLRTYEVENFARTVGEFIFLLVPREKLSITQILHCNNSTIQSRLISTYGEKEFFARLKAVRVHKDGDNELLKVTLGFRAELWMVKVVDTTTKQVYLLRVPPQVEVKPRTPTSRAVMMPMKTCKQAIAWTFGLKTVEYHPDGES